MSVYKENGSYSHANKQMRILKHQMPAYRLVGNNHSVFPDFVLDAQILDAFMFRDPRFLSTSNSAWSFMFLQATKPHCRRSQHVMRLIGGTAQQTDLRRSMRVHQTLPVLEDLTTIFCPEPPNCCAAREMRKHEAVSNGCLRDIREGILWF